MRSLRWLFLAALVAAWPAQAFWHGTAVVAGLGYLTDALAHQVGTVGQPAIGSTYVDPVFGGTVRRLSSNGTSGASNNYTGNGMFWNADGTRAIIYDPAGYRDVINTTTGVATNTHVPQGDNSANMFWDPNLPHIYYYYVGAALMQYDTSTSASSTVHTFPSTLQNLGGSVNYIDNTGNYFVVNYGSGTTIWDKANNVIYTGASALTIGTGWVGITPDAKYMIISGPNGVVDHYSFALDNVNHVVGSPVDFWSLCGDHGGMISPSDGKDYYITNNCYDQAQIYRVDVTLPQTVPPGGLSQQKSQNYALLTRTWSDDNHISCTARGTHQDWCFMNSEASVANSSPEIYWNEIIGLNVLTGAVRRYAHHLSDVSGNYYNQPRIDAMWDGSKVAYASTWGNTTDSIYAFSSTGLDLYALEISW